MVFVAAGSSATEYGQVPRRMGGRDFKGRQKGQRPHPKIYLTEVKCAAS